MRILFIGYGKTSRLIAKQLFAQGRQIVAVSRSTHLDSQIQHLQQDIHQLDLSTIEPIDCVYILLSPDHRDVQAYQNTYVNSITPIVQALKAHPVQRIILVSSTRVYGENAGEWLDDESAVHPTDEYGYMLYDMEQQWRKIYANQLIIVRPSGIYTEDSAYMTQLAYKTTVYPHVHYSNRIHQDDLVDFLVQLADLTQPKESYIVSNLQPLALHDVIKGRQRQLGLAMLHVENLNKITGKRLKPKHLREMGFVWQYPHYFAEDIATSS
jgi:nucleoside-diphosphate-sugar epimerase